MATSNASGHPDLPLATPDDSDDDSLVGSMFYADQHRRGSVSIYLAESWRAVESAAMRIPEAAELSHSMASRLGSATGSIRRSSHIMQSPGRPTATLDEKTTLLIKASEEESRHKPSPPLMKWIWIALLCALAYALYNIFIKKGSADIHPILGGVILQFVAAFLGAGLLGGIILYPGDDTKIHVERPGIVWSVGAGLWVGVAEITSFIVSGLGVPATQFIPINIGGSVAIGSVLGVVLLGETVMLHGWSGVALLIAGIAMVATDPGEKVEEGGDLMPLEGSVTPPPLVVWIGPALFCALSYALYNICIKKGSAYINPIVGAVILQFVAALLGTALLLFQCFVQGEKPYFTSQGILWAALAGVSVGAAELLSFGVSGMGVPASQSIPILIGGSVGFGAVLGIAMLGETLLGQGWCGVAILMLGIGLVATDPGEKVEGH